MDLSILFDFASIILADIVLSGDNALIIGMAAASLSPELRRPAIIYGMAVAAILRIIFAVFATYLLAIKGLLFLGGLLLLWVSWRLYGEIRENQACCNLPYFFHAIYRIFCLSFFALGSPPSVLFHAVLAGCRYSGEAALG